MAIFKILHEGGNKTELRKAVRYNSKNKKDFNNENNPRLIGVESNCGFCLNVQDENEYNQLVENFIMSVEANASLSKNRKKQAKLYEHSVLSFSEDDDKKYTLEELQKIALETCSLYDENFENTPYMLWPQRDSGKLHFHVVRGFHDENGKYHRQYRSGKKMEAASQKIEKLHDLTRTGKNNPNNWHTIDGKKVYVPEHKQKDFVFAKNKNLDYSIEIKEKDKVLSKKTKHKDTLKQSFLDIEKSEKSKQDIYKKTSEKNISKISELEEENNNLGFFSKHFTNIRKLNEEEISALNNKNIALKNDFNNFKQKSEKLKKPIILKVKKINTEINKTKSKKDSLVKDKKSFNENNIELDLLKETISTLYKENNDPIEFLEKLNAEGIQVTFTKRKNGLGGITFQNNKFSISGGKVNSQLTYGKLKNNNPKLFRLITGEDNYGFDCAERNEPENFRIESLNKLYKQSISNNGDTFIYFNKKDNIQYPNNYNLRISKDKDMISFTNISNKHDLKLAYETSKKLGWVSATSESKELVLNSMKAVYEENQDDLFFYKTKTPTLTIEELKDIVKDDTLSKNNLIKLYDKNIIVEEDKDNLKKYLYEQFRTKGYNSNKIIEHLDNGLSLKEALEKDDIKSSGSTSNTLTSSNKRTSNNRSTFKPKNPSPFN